jgi:hypothetical protein
LAKQVPSFASLTTAHLRLALKGPDPSTLSEFERLAKATKQELSSNTPFLRRAGAMLNPIGWYFTR